MTLDLFVKLKHESSTTILLVDIRYSMRDLLSDLNNYAWSAICVRYVKWCQRWSAHLSNLWILCLNDLLDEDLCKNLFYYHIFSFFSGFQKMILSDALILPVSQLQTQQVMTS